MKVSNLFGATLLALTLAACGGGGGDDDAAAGSGSSQGGGNSSGGESGGNGNTDNGGGIRYVDHAYFTLDYAPGGDFLSTYTVKFPYDASTEGEFKLGNSTVEYTDADPVSFKGYRNLFIGSASDDVGALLLCKEGNPESTVWHAVLPAKAVALSGAADEKLARLIAGKRFKFYEECGGTNEVFVVAADGSLSLEKGGVPVTADDEGATAAEVKDFLSANGFARHEAQDAETITTWMRLFDVQGKVHAVIVDKEQADAGGAPGFSVFYLVQE